MNAITYFKMLLLATKKTREICKFLIKLLIKFLIKMDKKKLEKVKSYNTYVHTLLAR